ncbi:MAG: diacylglycerol O-acyltransferase / wax synthase [Actinomycetota bacterium]|nr:diacylglycerol O-acyltransferase / wax synthase [Actinomycetota bacterium]
MKRLSGLDTAFLAIETPTAHMHVMSTAILDPSTAPATFDIDRVRELIRDRMHLLPPLARRLVTVPFDLHNPLWVEDPNFDLDYHVRRTALPSPGGLRELANLTAEIAGRPLDRSRPLWELWYVEGLEHDRVAIITKVHHSAIDGMSGVELIANLYDFEADPPARTEDPPRPDRRPDHVPSDPELLAYAVASFARQPLLLARAMRRLVRSATRVAQRARDQATNMTVPLTAPRLAMNGTITPHRKVAFSSVPLADVKTVKNAFGVKVNDVVLAVTSGALRTYLTGRDELPDRPLVATIPTSVRTEDQKTEMGNRVSAMFSGLPVEIDDPVERLLAVHRSTVGAKQMHDDIGGNTLQEWADLASPAIFSRAMRVYSNLRLADRHRPIHNLVISNVPGPPFPLYFAGARLVAIYPMGPIFDGAALNLTVMSYLDHVDFGFLVCRELVPDVDDLAAAVPDALAELVKAAEALDRPGFSRVAPRSAPSRR